MKVQRGANPEDSWQVGWVESAGFVVCRLDYGT